MKLNKLQTRGKNRNSLMISCVQVKKVETFTQVHINCSFTHSHMNNAFSFSSISSGGSKGRGHEGRTSLHLGVQIISISCSFWENWQNCVFTTPSYGLFTLPPGGNPGCVTDKYTSIVDSKWKEVSVWCTHYSSSGSRGPTGRCPPLVL